MINCTNLFSNHSHPDGSSIGKLKGKPVAALLKGRNVLAVYDNHLTVFRL